MAKKKGTKAKAKLKKRNYHLYLYTVGVVILIIIIVGVIRSGKKEAGPADVGATSPVEEILNPEKESGLPGAIEKSDCGTGAAIGYKACELLGNGDKKLTILHQGQDTLTGVKYYIYDGNGEKIAEATQTSLVKGGAEASYILPINQYAAAKKAMIVPVINLDGADYICLNQGIMVIPSTSCR